MNDALTTALIGLEPAERRIALSHLPEAIIQVGEHLTHRGDDDPAVAWVLAGEVELRIEGKPVYTVSRGGVVGGEDVYGDLRRTFTAVASAPSRVAVADRRDLERLRSEVPQVAAPLELGALRTLSAMVRALDSRVREDTRAFLREHDPKVGKGFPLLSGMWGVAPGAVASTRWRRPTMPPFLERLPNSLREIAEDAAVGVKVKPGDLLVQEGGPSDGVYILVEGRVQVLATVAPEVSIRLAELGPGAVVGSTSAILGTSHIASCMATEHVTAVRLDSAVWMGLLSVEAVEASALRVALLQSMSAWIPPIRDRVACSKRCLHGVIRAQLLTP